MEGRPEEKKASVVQSKMQEIKKAHAAIAKGATPEDLKKIMDELMDSIQVAVPLPVTISLEHTSSPHKEIRLIELSCNKQIEYERHAIELQVKAEGDIKDLKDDVTFEKAIDFDKTELAQLKKMVVMICDNGQNKDEQGNSFVTEEFCGDHLSRTMLLSILVCYMKEFVGPAFNERMRLTTFFSSLLMFSKPLTPGTSGGTG